MSTTNAETGHVEALRRAAWVAQLYRDYDEIAQRHKMALRRAVLRITEQTRAWGTWDAGLRTITLSAKLIENHPWDIVLEILKHEMAHQVVSELLGGGDLHGPAFAHACRYLNVAPWAQSASGALPPVMPHWRASAPSPEEERLLQRVEKLLALATSSNEHEAQLAMQRVHEMYARYNFTRLRHGNPSDMVTLVISRGKKRTSRVESSIFAILVEHFSVRAIWGETFDATTLQRVRCVELLGRKENILMAEYVYHFLWQQTHTLWATFQKASGKTAAAKASYQCGVLDGFAAKLRAGQKSAVARANAELGTDACAALVRQENRQLGQFVEARYPRLSSRTWGGPLQDAASFHSGRQDGERLTLHRGVGAKPARRGLLLG